MIIKRRISLNYFNINTFITNNFFPILISAIVGFLISTYFYRKGSLKKNISYAATSYTIIKHGVDTQINNERTLNKMEILFNNENIPNLTITKIAFWNSGNTVICENDIVQVCPFQIIGNDECMVLGADIITEAESTNQFILAVKDNCVSIKFDYMNTKDGIVIQLIHTGDREMLKYEGKIKGGKDLCETKSNDSLGIILLKKLKEKDKKLYNLLLESARLTSKIFITFYLAVLALMLDYAIYFDINLLKPVSCRLKVILAC